MPQIGSRSTSFRQRPQSLTASVTERIARIAPDSRWTGEPGSGFLSPPDDPVRLTAKPALRLIVPPNQFFTRQMLVGVMAYANANGTLIGGIDRVRFHFEGSSRDVLEQDFHTITRPDGSKYRCFAYWAMLERPASTTGEAQLYIEAIPADATMQSRVIGPYSFFPSDTLHDLELTINADEAEAGTNFQTLEAALEHIKSEGADNPLVTITKAGTYDIDSSALTADFGTAGWITVTASEPVTFAKSSYSTDAAADLNLKRNAMCWRGSNITFDMENILLLSGPNNNRDWWLDGCRFINSAGRYHLWRASVRPVGFLVDKTPWFTETIFEDVPDCCNLATLARGTDSTRIYGDFAGSPLCAVYNTIDDLSAVDGFLVDVPALEVTYTGAEATATLSYSGSNTKTVTAKYGANTETFTLLRTEAQWELVNDPGYDATTDGTGYFVQDVADWLNSLTGWSATVLDNTRAGVHLGLPGLKNNAFTNVNVKDVTLGLVTVIDFHGDFFQHRVGGNEENCIVAFNYGKEMRGQNIFISGGATPVRDFVFVNNAFANGLSETGYVQHGQVLSGQASNALHSHVVIAHNSMPTQRFRLRTENGLLLDSYCLHANNAFANLLWAGSIDEDLTISNVIADAEWEGEDTAATAFGGDYTSKFADSVNGDFTPAGELLANLVAPVVRLDVGGAARSAIAPVGAKA